MPQFLRQLRASWRNFRLPNLPPGNAIDPNYAKRTGIRETLRSWNNVPIKKEMRAGDEKLISWSRSGIVVARERYDRVAGQFGVEPRDPFMDRRVWEFCLSLPDSQLQTNGWPKIIMRRSMAGIVPDDVRWRKGKEHLGWTFTSKVMESWTNWPDVILESRTMLRGRIRDELLDTKTFERHGKGFWSDPASNLALSSALMCSKL